MFLWNVDADAQMRSFSITHEHSAGQSPKVSCEAPHFQSSPFTPGLYGLHISLIRLLAQTQTREDIIHTQS